MTKSAAIQVGVHEAKTRLSELLRMVDAGEEIEIARGGRPVARLVPIQQRRVPQLGVDEGVFEVPEDFDEPEPDIIDPFYA